MPTAVAERLGTDMASARTAARDGDEGAAWALLEEAHVLSQPWAWPHIKVHAAMLALGWRTRNRAEAAGQLLRIVVAGPGSLTGRYPKATPDGHRCPPPNRWRSLTSCARSSRSPDG